MPETDFQEVLFSIREAGRIWRGEQPPAETWVQNDPDVAAIRRSYDMTQLEFATLLGVPIGTVRNWEQKKRVPHGPASILLCIAEMHPGILLETLEM